MYSTMSTLTPTRRTVADRTPVHLLGTVGFPRAERATREWIPGYTNEHGIVLREVVAAERAAATAARAAAARFEHRVRLACALVIAAVIIAAPVSALAVFTLLA